MSPKVPGYCKIPHTISSFKLSKTLSSFPTRTLSPIGSALVFMRSIVCGWQFSDTNTSLQSFLFNL